MCDNFASALPGMAWAGMKCRNCSSPRREHPRERSPSSRAAAPYPTAPQPTQSTSIFGSVRRQLNPPEAGNVRRQSNTPEVGNVRRQPPEASGANVVSAPFEEKKLASSPVPQKSTPPTRSPRVPAQQGPRRTCATDFEWVCLSCNEINGSLHVACNTCGIPKLRPPNAGGPSSLEKIKPEVVPLSNSVRFELKNDLSHRTIVLNYEDPKRVRHIHPMQNLSAGKSGVCSTCREPANLFCATCNDSFLCNGCHGCFMFPITGSIFGAVRNTIRTFVRVKKWFNPPEAQLSDEETEKLINAAFVDRTKSLEIRIEAPSQRELDVLAFILKVLGVVPTSQVCVMSADTPCFYDTFGFDFNTEKTNFLERCWASLPEWISSEVTEAQEQKDRPKTVDMDGLKAKRKCRIGIVGNVGAGKSSFLNALLKRSIAPATEDVCTSSVLGISQRQGDHDSAVVHFFEKNVVNEKMVELQARITECREEVKNLEARRLELERHPNGNVGVKASINHFVGAKEIGSHIEVKVAEEKQWLLKLERMRAAADKVTSPFQGIEIKDLPKWCSANTNAENMSEVVSKAQVFIKAPLLEYVDLVDTPGMGDMDQYRGAIAQQELQRVDAWMFLIPANEKPSQLTAEQFQRCKKEGKKDYLIVFTKLDILEARESLPTVMKSRLASVPGAEKQSPIGCAANAVVTAQRLFHDPRAPSELMYRPFGVPFVERILESWELLDRFRVSLQDVLSMHKYQLACDLALEWSGLISVTKELRRLLLKYYDAQQRTMETKLLKVLDSELARIEGEFAEKLKRDEAEHKDLLDVYLKERLWAQQHERDRMSAKCDKLAKFHDKIMNDWKATIVNIREDLEGTKTKNGHLDLLPTSLSPKVVEAALPRLELFKIVSLKLWAGEINIDMYIQIQQHFNDSIETTVKKALASFQHDREAEEKEILGSEEHQLFEGDFYESLYADELLVPKHVAPLTDSLRLLESRAECIARVQKKVPASVECIRQIAIGALESLDRKGQKYLEGRISEQQRQVNAKYKKLKDRAHDLETLDRSKDHRVLKACVVQQIEVQIFLEKSGFEGKIQNALLEMPPRDVAFLKASGFDRVWHGKFDSKDPVYTAVRAKKTGSFPGAFFEKDHTNPNSQAQKKREWLGKLGTPKLNEGHTTTVGNENIAARGMERDAIKEKIGADCYLALSLVAYDRYTVPKYRLARLPILDPFTNEDPTTGHIYKFLQQGPQTITDSIRAMSKVVVGYRDLCELKIGAESSIEHIAKLTKSTSQLDDQLFGLLSILAAGRLLGDIDVLGDSGKNTGFVKESAGYVMVKIDPGLAFSFRHAKNRLAATRWPSEFKEAEPLKDPRDIQVGANGLVVPWSSLCCVQRRMFAKTLRQQAQFLQTPGVLDYLVTREDQFNRFSGPDNPDILKPAVIAEFRSALVANIKFQLEVYTNI